MCRAQGGEEVTGGRRKSCLEGRRRQKNPQKMHFQGSDGTNTDGGWLDGVRRGWRWRRMVGKCSTRPHAPTHEIQAVREETRVASAWMIFSLWCFEKTWRSPPCAPDGMVGVGKGLRRKRSPEKSPTVRIFFYDDEGFLTAIRLIRKL